MGFDLARMLDEQENVKSTNAGGMEFFSAVADADTVMNELGDITASVGNYMRAIDKLSAGKATYTKAVRNNRVTPELMQVLTAETQRVAFELHMGEMADDVRGIDQQSLNADATYYGKLDEQARDGLMAKAFTLAVKAWVNIMAFIKEKVAKAIAYIGNFEKAGKALTGVLEKDFEGDKAALFDPSVALDDDERSAFSKEFGGLFDIIGGEPKTATDLLSDYMATFEVDSDGFGSFATELIMKVIDTTGKPVEIKERPSLSTVTMKMQEAITKTLMAGDIKIAKDDDVVKKGLTDKKFGIEVLKVIGEEITFYFYRNDFNNVDDIDGRLHGVMSGTITGGKALEFKTLNIGKREDAVKLVASATKQAKNFSKTVDTLFKGVDKAGKEFANAYKSLPDEPSDSEKVAYRTAKQTYTITPTVAYNQARMKYTVLKNVIVFINRLATFAKKSKKDTTK